jgi:FkbM family methyltransferase
VLGRHRIAVEEPSSKSSRLGRRTPHKEIHLQQNGNACSIWGTPDHALDSFRGRFPLYDVQYPRLSSIVGAAAPGATILDVGANIGDSVALCRLEGCRAPIVAVEPSEIYFPFLVHNIATLPDLYGDTTAVQAYVGNPLHALSLDHAHGTATSVMNKTGVVGASQIPTFPLQHFKTTRMSLVKIDTDGYDAEILRSSLDFLSGEQPILWAEAVITGAGQLGDWAELMANLSSSYVFVTAFDNFGFPVVSGALEEKRQTILDLMAYYYCHQKYPSASHGSPTIYYVDLAFFPRCYEPVFNEFHSGLPA